MEKHKHHWLGHIKHAFQVDPGHSNIAIGNEGAQRSHYPATEASDPPSRRQSAQLPFADDHGLQEKWGRAGQLLGSGSSASVRVLTRASDGTSFAVKQFRKRPAWENKNAYAKKVTAEFSVGSNLHHGNVIKTLDVFEEHGTWFEVMEYAPYLLFPAALSGKMSTAEITCCTKQVFEGVHYMHSSGFAHRDLKLENICLSSEGIIKLIDFGAAVVFRDPNRNKIVKASGIEGTEFYMAPEVLDLDYYEPQRADVWSLAVIYFCLVTTYFPWGRPSQSDHEFALFRTQPPLHDNDDERPTVGPGRVLRRLPVESRSTIEQMLLIDPLQRPETERILQGSWLAGVDACSQASNGEVHRAPGHEHLLMTKSVE